MKWLAGILLRINLAFASLRHRDQKDVEYYLESVDGDFKVVPASKGSHKGVVNLEEISKEEKERINRRVYEEFYPGSTGNPTQYD